MWMIWDGRNHEIISISHSKLLPMGMLDILAGILVWADTSRYVDWMMGGRCNWCTAACRAPVQCSVDADLLGIRPAAATAAGIITRAGNQPSRSLKFYTEKAHSRVFSLLKVVTTVFTFKNLLKHYAKQALTHGKIAKLRTSQRFVPALAVTAAG